IPCLDSDGCSPCELSCSPCELFGSPCEHFCCSPCEHFGSPCEHFSFLERPNTSVIACLTSASSMHPIMHRIRLPVRDSIHPVADRMRMALEIVGRDLPHRSA